MQVRVFLFIRISKFYTGEAGTENILCEKIWNNLQTKSSSPFREVAQFTVKISAKKSIIDNII